MDGTASVSEASSLVGRILPKLPILLLVLYVTQIVYRLFFHPLAKIPGPAGARWTALWRIKHYLAGTWFYDIVELHRKYGPVVRITPNEVSVVDEKALKAIYGYGKPNLKSGWYDTWMQPDDEISIFPVRQPDIHKLMRARSQPIYTMSNVLSYEPSIQELQRANWAEFRKLADAGKPIDLPQKINFLTFDIVCRLSIGAPLGFVKEEKDLLGLIESLEGGMALFSSFGDIKGFTRAFMGVMGPLSRFMDSSSGWDGFTAFMRERLAERRKNGLKPGQERDIMQATLEMRNADGKPLRDGEVLIEAGTIIGAGGHTTGAAIAGALAHMIKYPKMLQQARKEVDEAYTTLGLAEQGTEITYLEVAKLPYLVALLKETLRFEPSIPYALPRTLPSEGLEVAGNFIPGSCQLSVSSVAMNRDSSIFGEDADVFRPERWIAKDTSEEEAQRLQRMESSLMTFGMGSRNCIGKNLAMVTFYTTVAQFIRHFDAEFVDASKPWKIKSQWINVYRDFTVNLKQRPGY